MERSYGLLPTKEDKDHTILLMNQITQAPLQCTYKIRYEELHELMNSLVDKIVEKEKKICNIWKLYSRTSSGPPEKEKVHRVFW